SEWVVDGAEVSAMIGGAPTALVNDLEAVAAALPHLVSDDLTTLGTPAPLRPGRRTLLAVNVGTRFGAASAIWRDGPWHTCPSAAGHMTLGRIEAIADMPPDPTVENVLSGHGLAQLYERLAGDRTGALQRPADVFTAARVDSVAARTLEVFTIVLGRIAG